MEKKFEYKGYTFITKVLLHRNKEEKQDGDKIYDVFTACLTGFPFFDLEYVTEKDVVTTFEKQYKKAIETADSVWKEGHFSDLTTELSAIGFK